MRAAVVSMPSMELFRAQPESYRAKVLGNVPRVAVEAGVAQCWYEWLGDKGRFVGLSDFGASAPAPKLYAHFGVTADAVAEAARSLVKNELRQHGLHQAQADFRRRRVGQTGSGAR